MSRAPEIDNESAAATRFAVGELIVHQLFGYRGVIFDVDPQFSGSPQWYEQVARSRPPKEAPWYHVLVHGASHTTYVAERNLERDDQPAPIDHPELERLFERFNGERYLPRRRLN